MPPWWESSCARPRARSGQDAPPEFPDGRQDGPDAGHRPEGIGRQFPPRRLHPGQARALGNDVDDPEFVGQFDRHGPGLVLRTAGSAPLLEAFRGGNLARVQGRPRGENGQQLGLELADQGAVVGAESAGRGCEDRSVPLGQGDSATGKASEKIGRGHAINSSFA